MKIAIVGAGHIGGNCARQLRRVGHAVVLTYGRDLARLEQLAADLGGDTSVASPHDAVQASEVVVVSVPWSTLDDALGQMGSFDGRIVIDTTNQFGPGGALDLGGRTAARVNADRMIGARYTKSFNTLTAAFQAEVAGRSGDDRVVQWVCGDDVEATAAVVALLDEIGYAGIDLGAIDRCSVMEAPRRPGAVYGEEYRLPDAHAVVEAVRHQQPIPATPHYRS